MESEFNNYFPKHHKKLPILKHLNECPLGQKFKVQRVNAGYHAKRRLACLGIIPGVEIIKKKTAPFRGPVEIIVRGSSLVIGRGLASKIIVE